ncbi:Hypothetical predicted protein [Paramuricea clavata]|uniref:Uncharacterized protein n=1 Tax=Paramuricea clavata TaxID=317549 RepID=A0A7D9LJD0_PARCT|nr:Hypothetical predicted protein [Paramuricea clavata]
MSLEREEDVECLVKDSERQESIKEHRHELGLKHPITLDTYDLCEYCHRKKVSDFNFQCLKTFFVTLKLTLSRRTRSKFSYTNSKTLSASANVMPCTTNDLLTYCHKQVETLLSLLIKNLLTNFAEVKVKSY